jgi:transmembrane sensor
MTYSASQRQEASEWFVAIHSEDDPSTDILQAWLRWMDQDEGNRVAFESIAQAWHAQDGFAVTDMPSAKEIAADSYDGTQSVDEWLAIQSNVAIAHTPKDREATGHRTRFRRIAWLAAAVLSAVTLATITMNRYLAIHGPQSDAFATRTGEQIEITLADGSRVWLAPRSRLTVAFTADRRHIQLESGEAFFSVRKDHNRPFIVRSPSGDITAVGTAFDVRSLAGHVTVTVSEGIVSVATLAQLSAPKPAAVRVASGQQLTFTPTDRIDAMAITQTPTPGERARWREGVLVYRDEPLSDVVMDVARYSNTPIAVADATVGALRYSGVVYKDAVNEWATALPESFPVKIVTNGERRIIEAR